MFEPRDTWLSSGTHWSMSQTVCSPTTQGVYEPAFNVLLGKKISRSKDENPIYGTKLVTALLSGV